MKTTNLKVRRLTLFSIAIAILLLHSCGGGGSNYVAVAEEFTTAYCDTDFDKCNKLMFAKTKNRFVPSSERSDAEKQALKTMKEHFKTMKYKLKFNNERTKVDGELVTVVFDATSAKEASLSEEFVIELEKDEATGKWLVSRYDNPF